MVIAGIYFFGFFAHSLYLRKAVYGDGIYYFSWLRSIVIDTDIDFTNEYVRLGGMQPVLPSGIPGNKYALGPAILWAPSYLWIHSLVAGDGYTLPYQLAVGFTTVGLTVTGLVLLFLALGKYFSTAVSIASTLSIAVASNLFFYGSLDPANTHGLSFFSATLFLYLVLKNKKNWYALGASLGLCALIRPQDMLWGLLLLPNISRRTLFPAVVGFVLAFLPQMAAWQGLYNSFWLSPYLAGAEGFRFNISHVPSVLFSAQNGLFLWTPVTLLGFIGLFLLKSGRLAYRNYFLSVVALQILLVSSWSTWWQGASYSGRMFVSLLPIFAFGLAGLYQRFAQKGWRLGHFLRIAVLPLGVLNFLAILYFLLVN